MNFLTSDDRLAMLERTILSQSARITQLEAELKVANPDVYLAKVQAYSDGYHDGFADGDATARWGQ